MIRFTSTKLSAKNKKGILPVDENGYYSLVIGGLNAFNSMDNYYTLEGAKQLFEHSSVFMRKIQKGAVKCEMGHPKKLPGMSDDDYFSRLMHIEETNTCAHISEVWLDFSYKDLNNIGNGREPVIAIWAKLKPSGPYGNVLKEALDNPKENVFFSIRSFTSDYVQQSITYRVLKVIVTFDYVSEGGIAIANKFDAPTLESIIIPPSAILNYTQQKGSIGLENTTNITEALELLKPLNIPTGPTYLKW